MRVALLSANAPTGNAIGKQLAEKLAFFVERGAEVRVYLQSPHQVEPNVARFLQPITDLAEVLRDLCACDLVIAEYAQWYDLLNLLPGISGGKTRVVLNYHGVTPPRLWRDRHQRSGIEQSATRRSIVWCADAALVHSESSRRELLRATGFPAARVSVLGLVVPSPANETAPSPLGGEGWGEGGDLRGGFDPLTPSPSPPRGEGRILFVGRVAPNKDIPTLIAALAELRAEQPLLHAVIVGDTRDVYQLEMQRCLKLAAELGISDRVQFLDQVDEGRLAELYPTANVFVMPSLHEGFCLPVIEAMANGVPVIAARATALPETISDAGLTFMPGDAGELAKQLRRVLNVTHDAVTLSARRPRRIAVVSFRFGRDFVGGAETSLRKMADALQEAGCAVEVFTTCTRSEDDWRDDLPACTTVEDGLTIHRFPLDPHERERHLQSVRAIIEADGVVDAEAEAEYLCHSIHCEEIIRTLRDRGEEFDAILTGPYLFGLTHDIAAAFPGKTLVVPCFHDEPLARLKVWPTVYGAAGGILYHSPEEQRFAQAVLGVNHPNAIEAGTFVPRAAMTAPERRGRYVVYCGRFSREKNVPLLLDFARRYHEERDGGMRFIFIGQGNIRIPRVPFAENVGFASEAEKNALIAGAAALVQLSTQESLSLAVLEAWSHGVPVIVHRDCAVLAGQLSRCDGGASVSDYASFAAALDDLVANPVRWRILGEHGREFVTERHGSSAAFAGRLLAAIDNLRVPLAEQMRQRGLERARCFERSRWQAQFSAVIEGVLDNPPRPRRDDVRVQPQKSSCTVAAESGSILVPVRVTNLGTHAVVGDGPARMRLFCCVLRGDEVVTPIVDMDVPEVLGPTFSAPDGAEVDSQGRDAGPCRPFEAFETNDAAFLGLTPQAIDFRPSGAFRERRDNFDASGELTSSRLVMMIVPVPQVAGDYRVAFWAGTHDRLPADATTMLLQVRGDCIEHDHPCSGILGEVQRALIEAHARAELPDDYLDVTEGPLAGLKRRIKSKVLGNFKRSYVDVLSRQQSAVNEQLIAAVRQLADCCETLDHAVRQLQQKCAALESQLTNQTAGVEEPSRI